jgi:hypothetical protein
MKVTPEQESELEEVSKPLMLWMEKNLHPHTKIIMDSHHVELLEGVVGIPKK